jgi:predicted amidophosphoribosyltransferase
LCGVWLQAAIDVLFPPQCAACDAIGAGVCEACVPMHATPVDADVEAGMRVVALGAYSGALRRSILALKDGRRDVATSLGLRLAQLLEQGCALVPVPTTKARRRVRGIDGVAEIAAVAAAQRSGVVHRALTQRAGDAQRGRNRRERLEARGRFACVGLNGVPSVVLVDDVCTTGATLRDCRRVLEMAGTRVSGAVVVAAAKSGAPCNPPAKHH